MKRLEADQSTWRNQTLRKTTVGPGQGIGGEVTFRVRPDVQTIIIDIPIDLQHFEFEYELTNVTAARQAARSKAYENVNSGL